MSTGVNLTIDKNLIKMVGRKLYTSHPVIIVVRELLQNSVDACNAVKSRKNEISITIEENTTNNYIIVTCADNGIGMNKDTLINKFLCLGASGKRDNNESTGGFGIAKASLMSNDFWSVHTRNWYIDSNMLGSPLARVEKRIGTEVTCKITEKWNGSDIKYALGMVYMSSDVDVNLTYMRDDNVIIRDDKTGFRGNLNYQESDGKNWTLYLTESIDPQNDWYTNFDSYNFYRLNGLVQFMTYAYNRKGTIAVINLKTKLLPTDNNYPLSMSRENITGSFSENINTQLQKFSENPSMTKFNLSRSGREIKTKIKKGIVLDSNDCDIDNIPAIGKLQLCNETNNNLETDDKRLLRLWAGILILTVRKKDIFAVGITDDSCRAMRGYESGEYYYYLNVESLKRDILLYQWNNDALIHALHGLAVHEASHFEQDSHNENFTIEEMALKYASQMAIVDNMPKLRNIIRNLGIINQTR